MIISVTPFKPFDPFKLKLKLNNQEVFLNLHLISLFASFEQEVACMGMESGVESVTRTDGECILKVRLKDKGVYNLDVYVAEPDGDSTLRVIKRCQLEFKGK